MAHRNAGPETTAVVVTCGTTRYLRRTLEGIAAQAHIPTRVVIVDIWTSGRDLGTGDSLQALVTESQKNVTGTVRVKLYKGGIHAAGRKSKFSMYNPHIATMEADPTKAYNQDDATGFIRLNGLRLRVNSQVNGAKNLGR